MPLHRLILRFGLQLSIRTAGHIAAERAQTRFSAPILVFKFMLFPVTPETETATRLEKIDTEKKPIGIDLGAPSSSSAHRMVDKKNRHGFRRVNLGNKFRRLRHVERIVEQSSAE
jgi:hypothetical protein